MKSISRVNIFSLFFIYTATLGASVLPFAVCSQNSTAGIFSPLIALISAPAFCALYNKIHKHNLSGFEYIKENFSLRFSKICAFIVALYFSFSCIILLKSLCARLETTLPFLSREMCILVFICIAAIGVFGAHKAIFRTAPVLFSALIITLIIIIIVGVKGTDFTLVLPLKYSSFSSFLLSLLFPTGIFSFFGLIMFFFKPKIKKNARFTFVSFLSGAVPISLISAFTLGVFSPKLCERMNFPFFSVLRSADSVSAGGHFEAFFNAGWLLLSALVLCFCFYAAFSGVKTAFEVKNEKGDMVLLLILTLIILCFSLPEYLSLKNILTINSFLLPLFNIILGFVLPTFLVIFSKIKQIVHKNFTIP